MRGMNLLLPHEFRQTLIGLEMLMHGAITGYNKSAGKDSEHPGGRQPQGESSPPHLIYRERWVYARSEAHRLVIEEEALNELKAAKVRGAVSLAKVKTDRELVLEDGKSFTPKQVSQRYGYSETTIRKWRRDVGLDQETGEEPQETGESVREMARRTGLSKSSAHRLQQRTKVQRMFGKAA